MKGQDISSTLTDVYTHIVNTLIITMLILLTFKMLTLC